MSRWSRWSDWERFQAPPKLPPPKHGIKIKKAGSTWWGQRWIDALEQMSAGYSNRLARGRTYARAGRTHDLIVKAGLVTAKVTGSRPTPYKITLELAKLHDSAWKKAIEVMLEKAEFSAELLAGQMPKAIDEAFRKAGASLFPAKEADLATDCSCPDWANPCKHVAATHYVLAEAFDRDPFLLFELRGRTKDQVLEALRAARSSCASPKRGRRDARAGAARGSSVESEIPKVTLGKLKPADYDIPREAWPALHFSFDEPVTQGAVLRQLGAPLAWGEDGSPADLLSPLVRAAAEKARCIALAEPEADGEEVAVSGRAGVAMRSAGFPASPRKGAS